MTRYDWSGVTYSVSRRTDPRVAVAIKHALGESDSVANIGAGTGSYEPPQTVVAIEPSKVMIAQRGPRAAPAIQAAAEHLPLRSKAVDDALAVLTVHHWGGCAAGFGGDGPYRSSARSHPHLGQ
ncbi:methyltransferase domain-containing protein [Mycobacterium sp. 236(2023)]|uniref:methyltransferase domain-containing protein n=1 Tax=Mycobacterium sp. 236(2023) TaxID=3038163 RepID=UPI00324268B9